MHMAEALRIEAVTQSERLKPYGKTLKDATDHFLAHLEATAKSCTVWTLITEYNLTKAQDGLRERSLKDIRLRLNRFGEDYGDAMVSTVQPGQIDDWLRGLGLAKQSRKNYRTVLHAFFEYGVMRKYAPSNPVAETANPKPVNGAEEIFTNEQMMSLLEKAPHDFVPYLVIGAFAGLRSAEIERLDWSEVDLTSGQIYVKSEKAKTAQKRYVKIQENLAAWLAPHAKRAGPVADSERARVARAKTCEDAKVEWKPNGLRHSYGSNHLAYFEDAPKLAAQMGHTSTKMIYAHYRDVVHPDVAAKWWQIRPPADYSNVVAFQRESCG